MASIPVSTSGRSAIEVATDAVRGAGEVVVVRFPGDKSISYKEGRSNVVTDVDLLAEEKIIAVLRREYPDHGIMTEESDDVAGRSPYTWIVDPIDGTRNYAYGIPHFCVALALACDEEIVLGVIYDPVRGELFRAEKGSRAYLNDSPISVSDRESLSVSLAAFDLGYDPDIGQKMLKVAGALWPEVAAVRVMGSAALGLAYVACGRLDLYFHFSLYPWDLAAGIVLIGEAGGAVTEMEGQTVGIHSSTVVAANRKIHRDFVQKITR